METQQATHWVHDLSPYAIHFGDGIGIRWYGLAYLGGFLLAWWLLRLWSRRNQLPLDYKGITDAVFYIAISMMIGGRIGYCSFTIKPQMLALPGPLFKIPSRYLKCVKVAWRATVGSRGCLSAPGYSAVNVPLISSSSATQLLQPPVSASFSDELPTLLMVNYGDAPATCRGR